MRSRTLINERVSGGGEQFSADYSDGSEADQTIKAIVELAAAGCEVLTADPPA